MEEEEFCPFSNSIKCLGICEISGNPQACVEFYQPLPQPEEQQQPLEQEPLPNEPLLPSEQQEACSSGSDRFQFADEKRMAELAEGLVPENTAHSTKWALTNFQQWKRERNLSSRKQVAPPLVEYDRTSEGSTIQFQLSNQRVIERREDGGTTSSVHGDMGTAAAGMVLEGGPVGEYRGPECYIKPKGKSNLKIIRNAICSVCLAGEVNMSLKQKTLAELENTSATHVVILFRDTIGFKFRGIYSYNPGDRHVVRIYGTGPKEITELMTSHLYKYNSGQKEFKEIPSRSLSVSVDALTIKTEYWQTAARRKTKTLF